MVKEMYLELKGAHDRHIYNVFWSKCDNPKKLALFFPGFRYSTEAPAFHFLKQYLMDNNWAVLAIEYRYNENTALSRLSESEQEFYLLAEAKLLEHQFEKELNFDQYLFVGKSLGTTILYEVLRGTLSLLNKTYQALWLTPADYNKEIIECIVDKNIPSIYVVGECDRFYNKELVDKLRDKINGKCLVLENAGHAFEADTVEKTLLNHMKLIEFLKNNINI